jgi:hypothetical protein
VFQELVLAPRVLFCASDVFYWQCKRGSKSEGRKEFSYKPINIEQSGWLSSTEKRTGERWSVWKEQCEMYHTLDLTFNKDRLVAMAGITRLYQNASNPPLVPFLGCWKESLPRWLGWRRGLESNSTRIPPRNVGSNLPTWCWLSAPCQRIEFAFESQYAACLKVKEAQITWKGVELTSELLSSKLSVTGIVINIELHSNIVRLRKHGLHTDLPDAANQKLRQSRWVAENCDFDSESLEVSGRSTPCLLLFVGNELISEEVHLNFLILEKVQEVAGKDTKYKRIGMCCWEGTEGVNVKDLLSQFGRLGTGLDTIDRAPPKRTPSKSPVDQLAWILRVELTNEEKDNAFKAVERMFQRKAVDIELV